MVKAFRFAVCIGVVLLGGLLFAQQTPPPKPCPPEGFTGGFSHGCPQKQFANPSDISAMMAALPESILPFRWRRRWLSTSEIRRVRG
jgi:uncharacterized protein